MVSWFNSNDITSYFGVIALVDKESSNQRYLLVMNKDSGLLSAQLWDAVRSGGAVSSTSCSQDTWHHGCAIYVDATDHRVLLDNGGRGTGVANVTPLNIDRVSIGCSAWTPPSTFAEGLIAETAIYDLSAYPGATDSDKADYFEANVLPGLAAGDPPDEHPTGLLAYWSFRTASLEDEFDDFDLTAVGTAFSYEHAPVYGSLSGSISAQATLAGLINTTKVLQGSVSAQSALTGNLQWLKELAGSIGAQSGLTGLLNKISSLSGDISSQSSVAGSIDSVLVFTLAGLIAGQSGVDGYINAIEILNGQITAQAAVTAKLRDLSSLSGTVDAQVTVAGNLREIKLLAGLIAAQSNVLGFLGFSYSKIPPFMHKDLIDPYGDMGAWLWLAEIVVPTQTTQRIARNTVDVIYGGVTFSKSNFDPPGRISLTGDGSIPRIQLQVAQDGTGTLENIVNATKGGVNGTVKLIRTCEKYFEMPVAELERTYDILTAGSDPMWVTFSLGIPNPLTQRIPLWSYSSKVCPLATPSLFKGPRCQYAGEDTVCTGLLEDCRDNKINAVHWGAEIGLDPNAVRV